MRRLKWRVAPPENVSFTFNAIGSFSHGTNVLYKVCKQCRNWSDSQAKCKGWPAFVTVGTSNFAAVIILTVAVLRFDEATWLMYKLKTTCPLCSNANWPDLYQSGYNPCQSVLTTKLQNLCQSMQRTKWMVQMSSIIIKVLKAKVEFANSIDLDETAHYELPHLDLHCLITIFWILDMIYLQWNFLENLQT